MGFNEIRMCICFKLYYFLYRFLLLLCLFFFTSSEGTVRRVETRFGQKNQTKLVLTWLAIQLVLFILQPVKLVIFLPNDNKKRARANSFIATHFISLDKDKKNCCNQVSKQTMVQNLTQNQSHYLFLQILSSVWNFGLFPPLQVLLGCKLDVPFHNRNPQVFHQPVDSICPFPFFYMWSRVWRDCLPIATPLTWACPCACILVACHLRMLCTQGPHGHICIVDSHWYSFHHH